MLLNCLKPFAPPSAKSKSDFESKTAAINAETTTQSSYDLKEIKADSLWLAQQAGIDENTALRITVLEWQTRPAARLMAKFSEEETTSLQSAADVDNLRVSLAGPSFTEILRQKVGSAEGDFSSEENRRLRLRQLYLEERSHLLKTSRKLLTLSLYDTIPGTEDLPKPHGVDTMKSLCDLGTQIFKDKSTGDGNRQFLEECISATQTRLSELDEPGGWLGTAESSEELESTWRTTVVEEIVHVLQMLFLRLHASAEIPDADILVSWLRLMSDYNFLEVVPVVSPGCPSCRLSF